MKPWLAAIAAALTLAALPAGAAQAANAPALRVEGAVAAPATYSMPALSSLATTTVRAGGHSERAVPLETLVEAARPVLPQAKNAFLRVTVTVRARGAGPLTFALGELDPGFGNHPALLSVEEDGRALRSPALVVPGDTGDARQADRVDRLVVAVANPTPTTPPAPGAVTLHRGRHTHPLGATLLHALPARTITVSFQAGGGAQQHVETGPTLARVLAAAHVRVRPDTWVAAVGSDGYVAVVTPAEATVGGRTLLLATTEDGAELAQPRLVAAGDVKGGRYVSDVVDLVAGD